MLKASEACREGIDFINLYIDFHRASFGSTREEQEASVCALQARVGALYKIAVSRRVFLENTVEQLERGELSLVNNYDLQDECRSAYSDVWNAYNTFKRHTEEEYQCSHRTILEKLTPIGFTLRNIFRETLIQAEQITKKLFEIYGPNEPTLACESNFLDTSDDRDLSTMSPCAKSELLLRIVIEQINSALPRPHQFDPFKSTHEPILEQLGYSVTVRQYTLPHDLDHQNFLRVIEALDLSIRVNLKNQTVNFLLLKGSLPNHSGVILRQLATHQMINCLEVLIDMARAFKVLGGESPFLSNRFQTPEDRLRRQFYQWGLRDWELFPLDNTLFLLQNGLDAVTYDLHFRQATSRVLMASSEFLRYPISLDFWDSEQSK